MAIINHSLAFFLAFLVTTALRLVHGSITNPLVSPTPPMGFNNWARFQCGLNESLFTTTADAMVSKGLLAAGYNRLNLDDCWMQTSRSDQGLLQWNTTLFPQGIPWLVNYVKSKGFHFGIYEDAGNKTCGGYPGSLGYEATDAQTFSSWGINYLKLDGCNVDPYKGKTLQQTYQVIYGRWHDVLSNLSKPMVFSESAPAYFSGDSDFPKQNNESDWYRVMAWAPLYGELARHSNDIDVFGLYEPTEYWKSIMNNYAHNVLLARYQQPGFYNDPDFIIADWPWLTLEEKKSQFALWSAFSAPLIISANVQDLSPKEITYLTNKDIIAIDQDPLALQATLVSQDGNWDVLTKNLAGGDRLLTVLNRSNKTASTSINVERVGLTRDGKYTVKDLWTGSNQTVTTVIAIELPGHATAMYRFFKVPTATPTGMIFNSATRKCMTHIAASILFQDCAGTDSQVWGVSSQGLISPLSAPSLCLKADGGVSMVGCNPEDKKQLWAYYKSGNLVNHATKAKKCLYNTYPFVVVCGDELDSQVYSLPSGTMLH
ncbi:putative alpha-galactosidase [Microthyrium microscopicum]|uniref:Alpha-galactosidase n=1 Tax=Microthyrium microscopicum TaxID=703497 RepID=A0A6A6UIH4_9PEZI|nr:putative alpha-galactosidase [Microthyrium microscopicum]